MSNPDDITKILPCKLSDEDIVRKADVIASAYKDYEQVEAEKKEAMKDFNNAMKAQREIMKRCEKEIRERSEDREVICRWIEDRAHGCKRLVRQDTGDVVKEQTLTAEDMQEDLPYTAEGSHPDESDPMMQ